MSEQLTHPMFNQLDDSTKQVLTVTLRSEMVKAISGYEAIKNTNAHITPSEDMIMNAFQKCPLNKVRVVLCAQDPYYTANVCNGLAFASSRTMKIQASLMSIYKCLHQHKLITKIPGHGDLTSWATQGVLLLNSALTTLVGKANAHKKVWSSYTDAIIKHIGRVDNDKTVFILLGAFAQKKQPLIEGMHHTVLTWGHPSPINRHNRAGSELAFINCTCFSKANDELEQPINWNSINECDIATTPMTTSMTTPMTTPVSPTVNTTAQSAMQQPRQTTRTTTTTQSATQSAIQSTTVLEPGSSGVTWIFTDGAASGNGKSDCKGAWAVYITVRQSNTQYDSEFSGVLVKTTTEAPTNNRAELTAIQQAISRAIISIKQDDPFFANRTIAIISDSQYAINTITRWYSKWTSNSTKHKLAKKKNIDLIDAIYTELQQLKTLREVIFKHVRGHKGDPSLHQFYIYGNERVDKVCAALAKK